MSTPNISLSYPFTREQTSTLKAGDIVSLSGIVFTGRDRLHKHLAETHQTPVDLTEGAMFHCGPIVKQSPDGSWRIIAAGPTTSMREEPYMATVIAQQGIKIVIGKGGMGKNTLEACREHGCVYLQAVGGAAAVIATTVKKVLDVHFLDTFGATEAMWVLDVEGFAAVVGIDSHGSSLYDKVSARSAEKLAAL